MEKKKMERRHFMKATAAAAAGAALLGPATLAAGAARKARLRRALQFNRLPKELSDAEKLELAAKSGFQGIEVGRMQDVEKARELGKLAREAGVPVHSIVYGWWGPPGPDPNSEERKKEVAGLETNLRCAQAMGADAVLLVPGRVTEEVAYGDVYKRTQEQIRKLIPLARELSVVIAVENVWNKFLLSPLEFARYVDELDSPWVQAYFDVGNVIIYGFAQDWIRTLGKRIFKIHLKDFKRNGYKWANLRDGDVNWIEVRKALDEIGYDGFLTPELGSGGEDYLSDLNERIDLIFAGE